MDKRPNPLRLAAAFLLAWIGFTAPSCHSQSAFVPPDIWWNPDESGWAISISQQGDVIFAVLAVYNDPFGITPQPPVTPTWFVIPEMKAADGAPAQPVGYLGPPVVPPTFVGPIYSATGLAGERFIPRNISVRPEGEAKLTAFSDGSARLEFTIRSVSVVRHIARLTFQAFRPAPVYRVALSGWRTCAADTLSPRYLQLEDWSISQRPGGYVLQRSAPGSNVTGPITQGSLQITQAGATTKMTSTMLDGSWTFIVERSTTTQISGSFTAVSRDGQCTTAGAFSSVPPTM